MPDVLVLAYPPGTGKTAIVAREAAAAAERGAKVAIYVSTVALAVDFAPLIGLHARMIRGRSQWNPDVPGQRMCRRSEEAQEVGEAGHSAGRTLCPDCPFKPTCAYEAQFQSPPPILILAHAYLPIQRRGDWTPDKAVIDEAFWQVCIEYREVPFAEFLAAYPRGFEPALLAAFEKGFRGGDILAHLRALPDVAALIGAAIKLAFQGTTPPRFSASDTVADIRRKGGRQRQAVMFNRILRSLVAEMSSAPGRPVSHTVRLVGDTLQCSSLKELRALDGVEKVLVIDAQADKSIIERVMPGRTIRYERKDAPRNADVVQVTCSTNGVGRLKDNPGHVAKIVRFASQLWLDLAWRMSNEDRANVKELILLVVPKAIRHKLTGEPTDKGTLPVSYRLGKVDIVHYGNVKGSNHFEKHHAAVLLGRSQLPPSAIEQLSGLFMHDAEPLMFSNEYERQDRGYCHPDGRGASIEVHPDPRFQSLLEQSREWECLQALDRLRLYGEVRKTVCLFTNLVLPIQVSRFVTEREAIPAWRDLAIRNGGLILHSPAWLAKKFTEVFASASVAKDWLKEGWWQAPFSGCPPDPLMPIVVQYRPTPTRADRQSGFRRALFVGDPSGIGAALNIAVGKPTDFVASTFDWFATTESIELPNANPTIVRESEG